MAPPEKIVIVGAGPVGSLAALYAAQRNYQVELYELRPGQSSSKFSTAIVSCRVLPAQVTAHPAATMGGHRWSHDMCANMRHNKICETRAPSRSTLQGQLTSRYLNEASMLCAMPDSPDSWNM
jgi:kynurenine 3-monooxygenase